MALIDKININSLRPKTMRLIYCLFIFSWSAAFAATDYTPPITILKDHTLITVKADGTSDKVVEQLVQFDTEQGVSEYATEVQPFNSKTETIKLLEAYTLKPDGTKIPVSKRGIRIQSAAVAGDATRFSDTKNLVIVFPNVEKDSKTYFRVLKRQFKTQFSGYFSFRDYFPPNFATLDASIEIRHDPKIQIKVEAPGMSGGMQASIQGLTRYVYHYRNIETLPSESNQVDFADFAPQLRASNFENWEAVGKAYAAQSRKAATVTNKVQKLAEQITKDSTDRFGQMKALYNWVSRNIRYVSIDLGNGGVIPHSADSIIDNYYGDCKDHATLLQALLSAKGISSSQVLIQSGNAYKLPNIPGFFPFNHAINYIPEIDTYLDSTAQFAPFGVLPSDERDKPVVLTDLAEVSKTPIGKAAENELSVESKMIMQPDGRIIGSSHIRATGNEEIEMRSIYNAYVGDSAEEVTRNLLYKAHETGFGTLKTSDPLDLSKPFEIDSHYTLEPLANVPGPSGMKVPVGLGGGFFTGIAAYKPLDVMHFARNCTTARIVENTTLDFPENITIEAIPNDVKLKGPGKTYQTTYQLKGNQLTMKRSLERQFDKGYCDPSVHEADKVFIQAVRKDLRSQIIYR